MLTDESLLSVDDSPRQASKPIVQIVSGVPADLLAEVETGARPSLTKLGSSRLTVETAQGAPQMPGRRGSSSFIDLDDVSSDEEDGKDNLIDIAKATKCRNNEESPPDLTSILYSSGDISSERDLSDSGGINGEITA
jgi:hypothetical protein